MVVRKVRRGLLIRRVLVAEFWLRQILLMRLALAWIRTTVNDASILWWAATKGANSRVRPRSLFLRFLSWLRCWIFATVEPAQAIGHILTIFQILEAIVCWFLFEKWRLLEKVITIIGLVFPRVIVFLKLFWLLILEMRWVWCGHWL